MMGNRARINANTHRAETKIRNAWGEREDEDIGEEGEGA
jgi:hypothetical protein